MPLPDDVARCHGMEMDGEWREGCEDCQRRTDRTPRYGGPWVEPPLIVVFECELRIAPIGE